MGDVGECFLNDAVGGNLDRGGQRRELIRRVDRDVEPGCSLRRVVFRGITNRTDQAQFVESRRAQIVDEAPNLGERCFYV